MNKKIFFNIILILVLSILISGCGTPVEEVKSSTNSSSMFIKIEGVAASNWIVVYHRETKVMYSISNGYNSTGVFTLLVNPDGSPMLYQETD